MRKTLILAILWAMLAVYGLMINPHERNHPVGDWIITVGSCVQSVVGLVRLVRERRRSSVSRNNI